MANRGEEAEDDLPEDPRLRLLRWLVTGLTGVLFLGVITIIGLLVIRLLAPVTAPPALPDSLSLPAGEVAEAATLGRGWVLVVTRDAAGRERIRLFDAASGAPRQVVEIAPAP